MKPIAHRIAWSLVACTAVVTLARTGESRMAHAIAVKVNGQPIYLREIEAFAGMKAKQMTEAGMEITPEQEQQLVRGAIRELVSSRLIRQQALLNRIGVSDETVTKRIDRMDIEDNKHTRRSVKDDILFERLMKKERTPVSEPCPREVREYYLDNQEAFSRPRRVRARHITVPKALPETRASELRRIKRIRREAMEADATFVEVAQRRGGTALDRQSGGLILFDEAKAHQFFFNPQRADLRAKGVYPPAMLEALIDLPPKTVSEVIESENGFHILYIDAEIPAQTLQFSQVQGRIRDHLFRLRRIRLQRKWLKRIIEKSRITWRDNTPVEPEEVIPPLPDFQANSGNR